MYAFHHLMATDDNDENDVGRPPLDSWDETNKSQAKQDMPTNQV
jgi:hypothetical protein